MLRIITRNDFLPMLWQRKLLITEYVLSLQLLSEALTFITSSLAHNLLNTSISFSVSTSPACGVSESLICGILNLVVFFC